MDTNKQYTWWLKALSGADEVQARRFAGAIALEIGWGGISKVEELTGMSHSTISRGIEELKTSEKLEQPERLRGHGKTTYPILPIKTGNKSAFICVYLLFVFQNIAALFFGNPLERLVEEEKRQK